ncbi:MAG: PIG-L family deacetylase, partial [Oscillospiraceae bacterium]
MKIFVPSDMDDEQALAETTHLAISAHQDDIEFMAYDGILKCFGSSENHFTAAIATNGAGSPRSGIYASFSDEEMQNVRIEEQKKAAIVGEYSAQVFLDFPSSAIKEKGNREAIDSIKEVIKKTTPKVIYTHNLADKHDTHLGVVLKVITALRELDYKVDALYGCEVWRGLDWVCDDEKVLFDVAGRPNLEASLLGVFDSQISGGKRYDLAVVGRRLANATFGQSHGVDETTGVIYGMDLTPLIDDPNSSIDEYI